MPDLQAPKHRPRGLPLSCAVAPALAGCGGTQSVLHPQGPHADAVADMAMVLFVAGALIFAAVAAMTAFALLADPERRAWMAREGFIVAAGIAFPVVTLTALLAYALAMSSPFASAAAPAVRIEVTGKQWWWHVRYPGPQGTAGVVTANEVRVPVGRDVEIALASDDVIHSFWVPNLAGKLDMIPGRVNRLRLRADRQGVFRGQCAEYCGGPHARMAFHVVAMPPADFAAWLAQASAPARSPQSELAVQGRALFLAGPCAVCHAVRGTSAAGELGPDLTHVGSRPTIGAGLLPNNAGTLAAWIASSQHLKPGNLMPSFTGYSGMELRALATFLEELR